MAVIVGDKVDGQTQVPKPTGATDAVEVRLGILGEVEVDHHVDRLDVDTAREQVCGGMNAQACRKRVRKKKMQKKQTRGRTATGLVITALVFWVACGVVGFRRGS